MDAITEKRQKVIDGYVVKMLRDIGPISGGVIGSVLESRGLCRKEEDTKEVAHKALKRLMYRGLVEKIAAVLRQGLDYNPGTLYGLVMPEKQAAENPEAEAAAILNRACRAAVRKYSERLREGVRYDLKTRVAALQYVAKKKCAVLDAVQAKQWLGLPKYHSFDVVLRWGEALFAVYIIVDPLELSGQELTRALAYKFRGVSGLAPKYRVLALLPGAEAAARCVAALDGAAWLSSEVARRISIATPFESLAEWAQFIDRVAQKPADSEPEYSVWENETVIAHYVAAHAGLVEEMRFPCFPGMPEEDAQVKIEWAETRTLAGIRRISEAVARAEAGQSPPVLGAVRTHKDVRLLARVLKLPRSAPLLWVAVDEPEHRAVYHPDGQPYETFMRRRYQEEQEGRAS